MDVEGGVPQGSALSPLLLFIPAMADIEKDVEGRMGCNKKSTSFADDLVIWMVEEIIM